jgi:hypothetical protein
MRLFLVGLVGLVLASSSCDGNDRDCACTVSIGDETLNLACGESGCVGGYGFGCDNDNVQPLGRCSRDDGGACVPAGAVCDPSTATCCPSGDGGTAAPTCDPTSHRCCAAAGTPCASSADCCPDHSCVSTQDGLRCST